MKSIFTLLFTLTILFSSAQNASLKGKITSADGKAVSFANVLILGTNNGVSADENGDFLIKDLSQGQHIVSVSAIGFLPEQYGFSIKGNEQLSINFSLNQNTELLEEIVVNGALGQNLVIAKLGKSGIKAMDLPQSVYTIDSKTLQNQQVRSMQDVLMNTNGLYIMGSTGGYQEEVAGRGFAFRSDNTLKNGVRYFNGMMSEMSGIERVEVLKGSAAILYGNVSAGGVINMVTKKPQFEKGGSLGLRTGSFGLIKPTIDFYGSLNKNNTLAYRINSSYTSQNSFRNDVSSKSFYINPSLLYQINTNTQLLVEADYFKDNRTPDFGAGIINYEILPDFPRSRFLGVKWGYFKGLQSSQTATLTHRFNKNMEMDFMVAHRNYATDLFANARPNSGTLISQDGTWTRNIQRSESKDDYLLAQANLRAVFQSGSIIHKVLVGFDADKASNQNTSYNPFNNYDQVNVLQDLPANSGLDIPTLTKASITDNPYKRFGIYAQDLIALSSKIKFLAGLRYSLQENENNIFTVANGETVSTLTPAVIAFSPRLGLVFQPTKRNSIFASYSNSFEVNTGVNTNGNALPPSTYNQYEVGIKNELFNGNLSANITAYLIDNDNLAQQSLANGNTNRNIKELSGAVRSKGLEIDIVYNLSTKLKMMAGYSFNQTQYIKSNIYIIGDYLRYNPKHTANASVFYKVNTSWDLGITAAYIGDRFAGRNAIATSTKDYRKNIPVPAYAQVDATSSFTYKKFQIMAKVGNLFNVLSYNVHDDNSVNPIAPTNFSLGINFKF